MTDRVTITITASNGASQTFQAVGRDAAKMGDAIDQASTKGKRSFSDWGKAATAAGAAIGGLGAVAIKLAGDAEAAQARLTTAFTNAGLAVEDYQDRIDKLADQGLKLAFDDEDVTDSLARLVNATGDYQSAVDDLGLAQDLARSRQISLAEATQTVLAVEAGRFRSLAQMGIVLDENASKEEALAAIQERVAGSAEAYAATGAASFERWQNTAENALEAVGARFVDLQGPILAASAAITAFGTVSSALKDVEIGAKLASLAMGPAGMVAAAGLAVGGIILLAKTLDDASLSSKEAAKGLDDFNTLIAELGSSGASVDLTTALAGYVDDLERLAGQSTSATAQLGPLYDELDRLNTLIDQNRAAPDYLQEDTAAYEAQAEAIQKQIDAMEAAQISTEDYGAAQEAIADIVQRTGQINYPILIDRLNELTDEFARGTITADEFVWNLKYLQDNAATYGVTLAELADQQREVTTTTRDYVEATLEARSATAEHAKVERDRFAAMAETITAGDHATITIDQITAAMHGNNDAAILNTEAIKQYADAIEQMPAGETFGARLAGRASAAGNALGDAFRTGVGNIGDLGGQAQQVADWADSLTNVEDGYSVLNQLLDEGRLTVDQYNDAIDAGNVIQSENAEIQQNVLDIQASQAPILADLTAQQQRYLEHIAQQAPELQTVALAYMDAETSAKGLELAQLAAAAAAGELGVAGTETAQKMIIGAAEADPYLKAMLEDMGLISVGADGTITVNFDSVEGADSAIDSLNTTLGLLTNVLATVYSLQIDSSGAVKVQTDADAAASSVRILAGTSAFPTVTDNGGGAQVAADAGAALAAVNALNGAHATATITTVVETITKNTLFAHGGVVGGYDDGGVVARMAEAGPELLHFRDGGTGWAMTDGLYGVPRGTYVTPAPASKRALGGDGGGIHVHGPVNIYPATGDVQREFTAALVGDWRG